eukprot:scaffold317514_cov37-Prasinocladus_malaysianus.AAC.2
MDRVGINHNENGTFNGTSHAGRPKLVAGIVRPLVQRPSMYGSDSSDYRSGVERRSNYEYE